MRRRRLSLAFTRAAIDVRPLRRPDFRRLWLGQGVAFLGFQLTAVAVSVQIFDLTGSSLWVGVLGLANLVPLVVFGLWGGAVADAMDRRTLLLAGSLLTWVGTIGLLLVTVLGTGLVPVLIGCVVVQSVGFAMAAPTRGAIIPRLLPVDLVAAGNTLNFTMSQFGTVAGPLLAGTVIGRFGYGVAYALDAALFTAGLYAAYRLPRLPPLGERVTANARAVVDGLRFIVSNRVLLMSFVVDIVAMVLAMPRALMPELARTRFAGLDGGDTAVGWLFASIAIGAVVGGVFSGWIGRVRRQGAALLVSVAAWGAAVALAGLAGALWLAVLLLAVAGLCDLVSAVYRQTILQTYAPDEMRGRMQGVFIVVVAGGPRLGDMRAGATAALAGVGVSWVGGGLACVLVTAVVAALSPALRDYAARPRSTR